MSKAKRQQKKAAKKAEPKKKVMKKLKEKLKGAGKKLGLAGKDLVFANTLPFKKLMKRELDNAHIAHTDHIGDIATKFLNHIIRKKNFDDRHSFSSIGTDGEYNLIEEAAEGIVTAILQFFKNLKKKKEDAAAGKGEPLTPQEEKLLAGAEEATDYVTEAAEEEAKSQSTEMLKEFLFSWKGAVSLAILLGLVIWIIRKS